MTPAGVRVEVRARGAVADLLADGREIASGLELRPRDPGDWGHSVNPAGAPRWRRFAGRDALGPFAATAVRRRWNRPGEDATLELRLHADRGVVVGAVLPHGRKPLRPVAGLRAILSEFPGLVRLLALHRSSPWWTVPAFADSPAGVPSPSQLVWWDAGGGCFGALLPLCGGDLKGELTVVDRALGVDLSAFAPGARADRAPAFALAVARDPYAALDAAFDAAAAELPGALGRRRPDSPYPEVFEHLGWCSWNSFYQEVSTRKLIRSANALRRTGVPFRWMLIDDGWSAVSRDRRHRGQLWSFGADPVRFPGGLGRAVAELKRTSGIHWVGVWHAFQGYWNGVDPRGPAAREARRALVPAPAGARVPDPRPGRGAAFYDAWHRAIADAGVDFVKVDNQGSVQATLAGSRPLFPAMRGQHANLLASVRRHFAGRIVHCMAMSTESAYTWGDVAVARNSDDYIPGQRLNHRDHVWANAYNAPWTSRLAWPDFDMWESGRPHAEVHAVLRAVSGGPVYVTDRPGESDPAILGRLCLTDGRLLRADEPAQPTPDVLFVNPQEQRVPLKVWTRAGRVGVVAAFNVHKPGRGVGGSVGLADVPGLPPEPHLLVSWRTRRVATVDAHARAPLALAPDDWALYFLIRPARGFAPVGLIDRYLSPKAIQSWQVVGRCAEVLLEDGGRFAFHAVRPPRGVWVNLRRVPPGKLRRDGDLTVIDLPRGGRPNLGFELA